jgi:hypothetical protein
LFAELLKKQFDTRVNLTILRILFRDELQDFEALELRIFEQDLEYFKISWSSSLSVTYFLGIIRQRYKNPKTFANPLNKGFED